MTSSINTTVVCLRSTTYHSIVGSSPSYHIQPQRWFVSMLSISHLNETLRTDPSIYPAYAEPLDGLFSCSDSHMIVYFFLINVPIKAASKLDTHYSVFRPLGSQHWCRGYISVGGHITLGLCQHQLTYNAILRSKIILSFATISFS